MRVRAGAVPAAVRERAASYGGDKVDRNRNFYYEELFANVQVQKLMRVLTIKLRPPPMVVVMRRGQTYRVLCARVESENPGNSSSNYPGSICTA